MTATYLTRPLMILAAAGMLGIAAQPVDAEDLCKSDVPVDELEPEAAKALYDCAIEGLVAGWQSQGHPDAAEYRDWAPASAYAAAQGTHGNRMLFTFANEIAAAEYLKFADEGVEMPVGSIIAKESFSLHGDGEKKGQVKPGPLFLMEKVAKGTFDETANWKYTLITPAGKAWVESGVTDPAKVQQFCHECHSATLEFQDALFYPVEEARVAGN